MSQSLYPKEWQSLWRRHQDKRLPHALLLMGSNTEEIKSFALDFSHAILCQAASEEGKPCEECHDCHLIKASSHADFILLEPEEKSTVIKIDAIREAIQLVSETAWQGGYRSVVIHPASAMNVNAANALLKTLEEPGPGVLLILISDLNVRLPATIQSRCQKIVFRNSLDSKGSEWESIAQALSLKLSQLQRGEINPLQVATEWSDIDLALLLDILLDYLKTLLQDILLENQQSVSVSQSALLQYIDHVQSIKKHIVNGLHLNRQLLLEELWIRWVHHVSG
jgi:DNA polymerase-3 subunit delta'